MVGELFVSLSEIGDDLAVGVILRQAKVKLPADIFPKFRSEMQEIRLGPKDKQLIKEAGTALARKYTFLQKWGPELILLICFVQYTSRMAMALRTISSLPDPKPAASPVAVAAEKPAAA